MASMTFTLDDLTKLIAKRTFCTLATQGLHGPQISGVGYFADGLDLYIPTSMKTAKARNIQRDSRVAVHIPVPWPLIPAPPKSIQFRGRAEMLPISDTSANAALEHSSMMMRRVFRRLLEQADTAVWGDPVWIRVRPVGRIETFMVGVPMFTLFQDESKAMLHFDVAEKGESTTKKD